MTAHARFWMAALILAVVIVGGFALSVPHAREVAESVPQEDAVSETAPLVSLEDSYDEGVRTIEGVVLAPDACATVGAEAVLAVERIQVDVMVMRDEELCLEIPAEREFSASIEAADDAPLDVRINGVLATSTAP